MENGDDVCEPHTVNLRSCVRFSDLAVFHRFHAVFLECMPEKGGVPGSIPGMYLSILPVFRRRLRAELGGARI